MVRRQDEYTSRQALTDDMITAIMMDMCELVMRRYPVLDSDPIDVAAMSHPARDEYYGECKEYAVGNYKGK